MPGRKASEEARRGQILRAAFDVAARKGLAGLTVRHVAAKAGLSNGLVLFHFKSKELLVDALFDYVLESTTVPLPTDDIGLIPSPQDRFLTLLVCEMNRLSSEPRRIRLFFDFWTRGFTHPRIRAKMRADLERYREAFRATAEEVLAAEPSRFSQVSAQGLTAVAVSFIKGCAIQSMIDPKNFDVAEFLAAFHGLIGQFAPEAGSVPSGADVKQARFAKRSVGGRRSSDKKPVPSCLAV